MEAKMGSKVSKTEQTDLPTHVHIVPVYVPQMTKIEVNFILALEFSIFLSIYTEYFFIVYKNYRKIIILTGIEIYFNYFWMIF